MNPACRRRQTRGRPNNSSREGPPQGSRVLIPAANPRYSEPPMEPAVPPDAPTEVEVVLAELDALRRKVDDLAAVARKNQLSLGELADSVGKLVATQRRRERSHVMSSFVAYLIFTVL